MAAAAAGTGLGGWDEDLVAHLREPRVRRRATPLLPLPRVRVRALPPHVGAMLVEVTLLAFLVEVKGLQRVPVVHGLGSGAAAA